MGIKKRNDSELLTNSRGSHLRAIRIKTYVGKYPYICLLPERPVTKRHCKTKNISANSHLQARHKIKIPKLFGTLAYQH